MNKCPHGVPRPVDATYIGRKIAPIQREPAVRLIRDSRECPDCLREQVIEANALLNQIFLRRGILDAATYAQWTKYVERYNP